MSEKETILILNGVKYRLSVLLQQGKIGPVIQVKEEELNDDTNPEHVPVLEPQFESIDDHGILLYKQHGKYTVLAGRNRVAANRADPKYKGTMSGRLLSSVAIKNAKAVPSERSVPEPTYTPEFANTPRVTVTPVRSGYLGRSPDPNRVRR